MTRQMHLVGFYTVPVSHSTGSWSHPLSAKNLVGPALPQHVARVLEEGLFDMVFIPDGITFPGSFKGGFAEAYRAGAAGTLEFDPVVALTAMAAVTSRIGLGCTISTSFSHPYHIARQVGTLDVFSGGRAAWNVVTSHNDVQAQQFGMDTIPPTIERYDRADEVVEAVTGLWGTWDPDALVMDRRERVFIDPEKVRYLDYEGAFVRTRGPLSIPPSPQGRPLIMQAGASARGMDFAARWGEVIFAMQHTDDDIRAFRAEVRERAAALGRDPDGIKVVASIVPIVGETDLIARERQKFLRASVSIPSAMAILSAHSGLDLSDYALDTPIASIVADIGGAGVRGTAALLQQAENAGMRTLDEAVRDVGVTALTPEIVGTPRAIAERLAALFEEGATDGYMVTPPDLPGGFEEFVRGVVPELQDLGVFRRSYPEGTLRDIVGLPPVIAPRGETA